MGEVGSTHPVAAPLSEILKNIIASEAFLSEIKEYGIYCIIGGTLEWDFKEYKVLLHFQRYYIKTLPQIIFISHN